MSLVNHALASNGATASATNVLSGFGPAYAIDGDAGPGPYSGGGNAYANDGTFPAILTVTFDAAHVVSRLDLFTWNYTTSDPGYSNNLASLYGLGSFVADALVSGSWMRVASVTANTKAALDPLDITPVLATAIRLVISASKGGGGYPATVVEFEAWGDDAATGSTAVVTGRRWSRAFLGALS